MSPSLGEKPFKPSGPLPLTKKSSWGFQKVVQVVGRSYNIGTPLLLYLPQKVVSNLPCNLLKGAFFLFNQ